MLVIAMAVYVIALSPAAFLLLLHAYHVPTTSLTCLPGMHNSGLTHV